MPHLACPKCRQSVSDDALDAGQCPGCGYDGAMVTRASPKWAWLAATLAVVGVGLAAGAYLLVPRQQSIHQPRTHPIAAAAPAPAQPPEPIGRDIAPAPRSVLPRAQTQVSRELAPTPHAFSPPKKDPAPARVGPIVRIEGREVREKQINNPDGVVQLTDLNRDDRLTLTGKVRLLKIGTVGGKAVLDASGLIAEEIVMTGDVNDHAEVKLNAPMGKVTIGGHVEGSARLIVAAPGGEVVVARSGKLDEHAEVTVVAKDIDVNGRMSGQSRLVVTLTGGGMAAIGAMEENAAVIYK